MRDVNVSRQLAKNMSKQGRNKSQQTDKKSPIRRKKFALKAVRTFTFTLTLNTIVVRVAQEERWARLVKDILLN